jgi:hypothetical protein
MSLYNPGPLVKHGTNRLANTPHRGGGPETCLLPLRSGEGGTSSQIEKPEFHYKISVECCNIWENINLRFKLLNITRKP